MQMLVGTNSKTSEVQKFTTIEDAANFICGINPKVSAKNAIPNIKVALRGYEMKNGVKKPRLSAYGFDWTWSDVTACDEVEDSEVMEPEMEADDPWAVAQAVTVPAVEDKPLPKSVKRMERFMKKSAFLFKKNFIQGQHDYLLEWDRENPPKNALHRALRNIKRIYQGCGDLVM